MSPLRYSRRKLITSCAAFAALVVGATFLTWCFSGPSSDTVGLAASPDRGRRVKAIDKLSHRGGQAARQRLFEMTSDKDAHVAMTAVWGLAQNDDAANAKLLEQVLSDELRDARVRGEAASMLGKYKGVGTEVLTHTLEGSKDPRVRAGAVAGLHRRHDLTTIPVLVRSLRDPSPRVRRRVISAVHSMTSSRFAYDPESPPESQDLAIRKIEHFFEHVAKGPAKCPDGVAEGHGE